ncbi:MAG: 50S ribosomal protein L18e [Candidatus Diapherotrites archaeon]|nr:50S ribosomal protein L18e [Candidatus Diapherotrites archaeon]
MKRSGPTNPMTRQLVVQLDKQGKKTKQNVFRTLATLIQTSTRNRAEVNVDHLNGMAIRFKDKVFVVPGKVMGKGDVSEKMEVAALGFSQAARDKITGKQGTIYTLAQLIENNIPSSRMMVVK